MASLTLIWTAQLYFNYFSKNFSYLFIVHLPSRIYYKLKRTKMSQAIWILRYHLTNGAEQQYLNWFHTVHIPEKLARPGYLWAAHYEGQMVPFDQNENTKSYLALFGGTSTRTFLDPSPSELRGMQDDLTREMMTKRHSSQGAVFAFEWCASGSGEIQQPKSRHSCFFSSCCCGYFTVENQKRAYRN